MNLSTEESLNPILTMDSLINDNDSLGSSMSSESLNVSTFCPEVNEENNNHLISLLHQSVDEACIALYKPWESALCMDM